MHTNSWRALLLSFLFSGGVGAYQEEDWDDDWEEEVQAPYSISGFIEGGFGKFLQQNIVKHDQSLAELRGRLEFVYEFSQLTFNAKGDLAADDISGDIRWKTRELNLAGSLSENLDIKLGRQVLTWGTGDYLFLNDVFAKDWQSFFSGRDDEYLKSHADGLKLSYYWQDLGIDLVWSPKFNADTYITGERFSFFSPFMSQQIAPSNEFIVEEQNSDTFALRLTVPVYGTDVAMYFNKGFWNTPQAINNIGTPYFADLNTIGVSAQRAIGKGLVNFEWSYYKSEEDENGEYSNIPNSQARYLIGYEQELVKDVTASIQAYVEKTKHYEALIQNSANPQFENKENRTLVTSRVTYNTLQQKLRFSLFTFYSPSDSDWYVRPSVSYRASDTWNFALGANLFNGNYDYSFFGQHRDNSNVYLRVRYSL